jgi:hypothetical protein
MEMGRDHERAKRRLVGTLGAVVSVVLLVFNTAERRSESDLSKLRTPRRYWEDLSVAISRYVGEAPALETPPAIDSPEGVDLTHSYERFVARTAREGGLKAWQFWRTIPIKPFLERARLELRGSDDPGRAAVLTLGFRALGGVSPFLPLWIGGLFCLPVLFWTSWELTEAGYPWSAISVPILFASSPFAVEMLSLPYSAVGFYLLGLLVLVPFSTYCVLGKPGTTGVLLRALLAGSLWALSILCRSGALLLLPGYLVAAMVWAWRSRGASAQRLFVGRWGVPLMAIGCLLGPYAVVRQARHHEAWLGVWEGLGDFDRSKGHSFLDSAARKAAADAGATVPENLNWTPESEAVFRRLVIRDILSDPAWYLKILARRAFATLLQTKLWPYGPRDGFSVAPSESPAEGATDIYYRLVTPADFLGFGSYELELPAVLLLFPFVALVGLFAGRPLRPRLRSIDGGLGVLSCLVVSGLALPVLVTTASGPETQSFVLVYFLSAGLLLDLALRGVKRVSLEASRES